jgi:hypothetical protein
MPLADRQAHHVDESGSPSGPDDSMPSAWLWQKNNSIVEMLQSALANIDYVPDLASVSPRGPQVVACELVAAGD